MLKKALLPIFAIILISGCIGGTTDIGISQTEGIRINSFDFDPDLLTSGETGQLSLETENVGGVTAQNVEAHLFNTDYSVWGLDDTVEEFGTMYAPDPDRNVKGDKFPMTWTLTAPDVPEGIKANYNARVRVCYDYNTTTTTNFLALTADQWRIEQQQGKTEQTDVITQNSGAPIHFNIDARSPVIIYSSGGTNKLRLNVGATNVNPAQGLAYLDPDEDCMTLEDAKNKISVKVTVNDDSQTEEVILVNGKFGSKVFEFDLDDDITRQEINVFIESEYGYFVEAETSMEVRSKFV